MATGWGCVSSRKHRIMPSSFDQLPFTRCAIFLSKIHFSFFARVLKGGFEDTNFKTLYDFRSRFANFFENGIGIYKKRREFVSNHWRKNFNQITKSLNKLRRRSSRVRWYRTVSIRYPWTCDLRAFVKYSSKFFLAFVISKFDGPKVIPSRES